MPATIAEETTALQDAAAKARSYFEKATRDNGADYWRTKTDRGEPEWLTELCRAAHGEMMPDDFRYEFIVEALDALVEEEDPDDINLEPDYRTSRQLEWLASHSYRPGYCDEAGEEWGGDHRGGILGLVTLGYAYEQAEVLGLVRQWLETNTEVFDA